MSSNPFSALFGDIELVNNKGAKTSASSLSEKTAVALYFSAHWCPPCRGFTPKLAEFYNKNSASKNLEIVFLSSDKDDAAFSEYFNEMPWLAVPYSHRDVKEKLSKKYKVQGIPTLVILNKDGSVITTDGRSKVMKDPEAKEFPWQPKGFWEIFSGPLNGKDGQTTTTDSLKSLTAFGLYFSAHWCPPCRKFTPELVKTYNKMKADGKSFEIVFVSSDSDKESYDEYYGEMPWKVLPFGDERKDALDELFEVEGIPTFVVLEGATGKVITKNGRSAVSADPEGKEFPWHPKPLNSIEAADGDVLNGEACLIYFDDKLTDDKKNTLSKIASDYSEKWKDADPKPLHFFYGSSEGMGGRVKSFANLSGDPLLMVLNIPEGSKVLHKGGVDEADIRSFVDDFVAGKLESVGLKN
eukprot:TRINITY_DN11157_c0_g1_i1.p1 TRINITY_DN11157_c0_g1~~TRINITY_DN11157_c0_g1_i1.p1  ORF type:complete len:411 (+),score=121.16 TRINITY_DN11157_c0_g1_i1:55-1287(+)